MSAYVKKESVWSSYRFPLILIASIVFGSILGLIFGEKVMVLEPLGQIFINLMFTIVVPLVFLTVTNAIASMLDLKRLGKILGSMFAFFIGTGIIAAIIMITVVKIIPPAQGLNIVMEATEELDVVSLSQILTRAFTVEDFYLLLSRRNMMPLIVFSILIGLAICTICKEDDHLRKVLDSLTNAIMKVVSMVMLYAPIGLGAYFACLVGEFGPQLLGAYARTMAIYYLVCLAYFFIGFSLYAFIAAGRAGAKTYFKNILPAAVTALATQSSVATLPVNLGCAQKIGVAKDIREIVLPIGATMHMDGNVLSSILKISLLFGLFKQDFSGLGVFIPAVLISVLSAVAASGVPGGGLVSEMIIVTMFGFPPEAFPIVATIGFLVDPASTCMNVTGDTVASMFVSRIIEGKDWLTKKVAVSQVTPANK